jgi:spore coat protein A, manganese oxidase
MPRLPKLVDPNTMAAFTDPLPIPSIAKPVGGRRSPTDARKKLPLYSIPMQQIQSKVHRDLPPTPFWAYGSSVPGPVIESRSGEGFFVDWPNQLPQKHFLPIDHRLMGAESDKPAVRAVVHMHGAKTPPASDGYPEDWYVPGKTATYYYPNDQEAALLWYHDHAMGINRLNIYAGLMGLCIIRDKVEDLLDLPRGEYEVPMVLFDRFLTPDGRLYYPVSQRPEAPWVPEFFGNAILVNAKLLPYLDVKPAKYRLRILNASNGRFYRLSLENGQSLAQIGTDQGLLQAPVEIQMLTLAPGERADVIIDFALTQPGKNIILRNDTVGVMQFRVGGSAAESHPLPSSLRPVLRIPEQSAVRTRELTLEELDNVLDEPDTHLLNGARWHDPVTESPTINTTEIWSLINLTDDVHPIHLHLVRFQILDRRPLDVNEYLLKKTIRYTGPAFPPDANEAGWKDTVRATPGAVTRIIIPFEGYTGRYVWHCHLLEHEDNEMMRPYDVVASSHGKK